MHIWNVLHAAGWKYRTQKWRKKSPSGRHHTTLSGWIFATKARINNRKKNLLSHNISSTCAHNMVNFSPLAAEIDWRVWGTPANFNGFRVLASLLQQCHSTEASQTLHDVWLCPGLVEYLYTIGAKFTLRPPSLALSYIGSVTARHSSSGREPTLRHWAQGATYIQQGDHHVGHWSTF